MALKFVYSYSSTMTNFIVNAFKNNVTCNQITVEA